MSTEIWAQFLERLKNQVNDRSLTYLEGLSCRCMTDQQWDLCLPDRSTLNFVESNLSDKIYDVICDVLKSHSLNTQISVSYSLENDNSREEKTEPGFLFDPIRVVDVSKQNIQKAAFQVGRSFLFPASEDSPIVSSIEAREASHLNPNFTFDNFIKGGSNEMAYCAAKAVAANPAGAYNPLFIYGGVGLGKTHLMSAIGNEILQTSNLRVRYMTSEEFTNNYMEAVHDGRMKEFRDEVRKNYDVLLLDDIQFIAGKEGTQKEFFNAFNDLHSANKQIVLTSDKHPQEIKDLEERISSRLVSGLFVDIQLPEYETRLEILRKKSHLQNFYLPDDVAQYIAAKVNSHVRDLESCINRIKASAEIHNEHISMALAQKMIEPYYQSRTVLLDPDAIMQSVCRYFGISLDELLSKSRTKPIVYPRQIAMYLARTHTSLSYPDLGRAFKRDHSTIMNGVANVKKALSDKDAELQFDIKRLEDELFK